MKKFLLLFFVLALSFSQTLKAQDANNPYVYCIVLDKTLSMVGIDGTKQGTTNIWEDVQNYCCGMIDGFAPSSIVLFYTFDKELFGPDVFEIRGEAEKTAIKEKVLSVKVDGKYTWIAPNLDKVIKDVYQRYHPDYNIMIYLLTDGIEEKQPCDIQNVISDYEGYKGDYRHLYYVDLRGLLRNSKTPTANEYKKAFEEGEHADIVVGYPKIVNMSSLFKTISYEIKDSGENQNKFTITQYFQVTRGELTDDFSFEVSIPDEAVKDANFDIHPSKLSVRNMTPVQNEKGRYSVDFEIEQVNNVTLLDCQIPIQMKGCTGENTLTIDPSSFIVRFNKQPKTDTVHKTDTVYIGPQDKPQTVIVKNMTDKACDLKYPDELVESMFELEFSEGAVANNACVYWGLEGDWDKFSYEFSQGIVKGEVLTLNAGEYKDLVNGQKGVSVTLDGKSGTRKGDYLLSMKVKDLSENLQFNGNESSVDIRINYTPKPLWRVLLVPVVVLVALIIIIILVLHYLAKFPRGLLQLNNNTVQLKGKKEISVKEELKKLKIELNEGTDVILVKKRFASFQGPCVKEATGCSLMCNGAQLTKGKIIRRNQEVTGLTDKDGKRISIRYC